METYNILKIKQIHLPLVVDLVKSLSEEDCKKIDSNYVLLQDNKEKNDLKIHEEIITINNLYKNEISKDSLDFYYNTFNNNSLNSFIKDDMNEIRIKTKQIIEFAIHKVFFGYPVIIILKTPFIQKSLLFDLQLIMNEYKYRRSYVDSDSEVYERYE